MFSEELGAVNWESIFREAFEMFNNTLLGIYDLTCPLKSMKIRKKAARKPWVDDELLRMIDIRNAFNRTHINEPNEFSSAQFKDQRNLVNSTRRKKMRHFYGEEFKKNASNIKATWKIINGVIRGSPDPQQYSLNVGGEIVRDLDKNGDFLQSKKSIHTGSERANLLCQEQFSSTLYPHIRNTAINDNSHGKSLELLSSQTVVILVNTK
ncbi:hypothetical protein QYM36_015669 [Artemia franciscana]|uniref:Uncharacterized protein n=1 Tax=Artemia franciscana TaxID=6661 RepID=A0AA88HND7_ARTSF|nr:hypothetical protein QYM36_015669 [Artemia franciscana]